MVLHTLNAAPSSAAFRECCDVAQGEDAILLLGDGVYAAVASTALESLRSAGATVYALEADMRAAGLTAIDEVESVDMDGFVALTERYERQQAWY